LTRHTEKISAVQYNGYAHLKVIHFERLIIQNTLSETDPLSFLPLLALIDRRLAD
jgi:hypothetical protein